MTTHSRRSYDHRIKAQIILTGNPGLFPELGIPRSTALSWIRRGMSDVVALDEDIDVEAALRARVSELEHRVPMLIAVLRLVLAMVRALGLRLELARLPERTGAPAHVDPWPCPPRPARGEGLRSPRDVGEAHPRPRVATTTAAGLSAVVRTDRAPW